MAYNVENICKSYGELSVLNNLSMSFNEQKVTCILGPSGCGKTTLLNIISGIIKEDSGEILGFKGKSISYLFQEPRLLSWKSIEQNIEYVLNESIQKQNRKEIIDRYLDIVKLSEFREYYPEKISGGMQQRAAIARAFAFPSEILLMDEPFKSLDLMLKLDLYECFLKLLEEDKRTVLFVTHDIQDAIMLGDDIYILGTTPTMVKEMITNEIARNERSLKNKQLLELEEKLYSKLI